MLCQILFITLSENYLLVGKNFAFNLSILTADQLRAAD